MCIRDRIAGALAGLMTESGKLGFIGGMELDTTKGKIAGFEEAAKYVAEQEGKTVELLNVPYANSFSEDVYKRQVRAYADCDLRSGTDRANACQQRMGLSEGLSERCADPGTYDRGVVRDRGMSMEFVATAQ